VQGGGGDRLDRDDADGGVQGRDHAGDQAAAADRDEHRVEAGRDLVEQFQAEGAVAGHHARVVVGVAEQRARRGGVDRGRRERLGVLVADLDDPGAQLAQLGDLDGGSGHRHEDLGGDAQLAGRVRRREARVSAGGRDDAGRRQRRSGQDLVDHAAGLERAGVLGLLELEPEVAVGPHHGGLAHAPLEKPRRRPYVIGGNRSHLRTLGDAPAHAPRRDGRAFTHETRQVE
jgi:hypothetical protein